MVTRRALVWTALLTTAACGDDSSSKVFDARPQVDAAGATADARPADARPADAAAPDAARPDAGAPDALTPIGLDGGPPIPDAGAPDAGPIGPMSDAGVPPPPPDAAPPTPDAAPPPPDAGPPPPTTTYRVGVQFLDTLDPTNAYFSVTWGILHNLLVRNLVGYRHVAGPEGNVPIPDLATEIPEPTDGGLTYTFTLRPGAKFGPPLNRPITSHDIAYAFRRILFAPVEVPYGSYFFDLVAGMEGGPQDTLPESIAGIETPDDRTIVFHLTRPSGDFLRLLAMPAASAVPEEVIGCFDEPFAYGSVIIASGPYMVEGSEQLDTTSCATMQPHPGFIGDGEEVHLVLNPAYDRASDEPDARPALVGGFRFITLAEDSDPFAMLENGELENALIFVPPAVVDRYEADPVLRARLIIDDSAQLRFVGMNLTKPPFDDVHVRRALMYAVNRRLLAGLIGGKTGAEAATHIFPPSLTGGHPTASEYAPYGTGGDIDTARAEMMLSAYDEDPSGTRDGLCSGDACQGVHHVAPAGPPVATTIGRTVEQALLDLGIEVQTEYLPFGDLYEKIGDPATDVAVASAISWAPDYPDAGGFALPLFHSRSIVPQFNPNFSLVGLTQAQAAELGVRGSVIGVPSVDAEIDGCMAKTDPENRLQCWRDLDVILTEDVVPIVPIAWFKSITILGAAVTAFEFDQADGVPAFSRVDVDPTKQN